MKKELDAIKHAKSVKEYPDLSLEDNEYVVLDISRSRTGEMIIWGITAACAILLCIVAIAIANYLETPFLGTSLRVNASAMRYFWFLVFMLFILVLGIGCIADIVYRGNRLYVTNHRAIQKNRTSFFDYSKNVIKLERIEDVSYRQNGILQHMFSFGTIRMSTVGDETTYTFDYVDTPNDEVETISHLIYQCKNRRKED